MKRTSAIFILCLGLAILAGCAETMRDMADSVDSAFGDDKVEARTLATTSFAGCEFRATAVPSEYWSGKEEVHVDLVASCPHDRCLEIELLDEDGVPVRIDDHVQRAKLRVDGRSEFDCTVRVTRKVAGRIHSAVIREIPCDWMTR